MADKSYTATQYLRIAPAPGTSGGQNPAPFDLIRGTVDAPVTVVTDDTKDVVLESINWVYMPQSALGNGWIAQRDLTHEGDPRYTYLTPA